MSDLFLVCFGVLLGAYLTSREKKPSLPPAIQQRLAPYSVN